MQALQHILLHIHSSSSAASAANTSRHVTSLRHVTTRSTLQRRELMPVTRQGAHTPITHIQNTFNNHHETILRTQLPLSHACRTDGASCDIASLISRMTLPCASCRAPFYVAEQVLPFKMATSSLVRGAGQAQAQVLRPAMFVLHPSVVV